ncbi:MAG: preprotein translocase subunit SecE [Candidatus Eremiobacteraeota bacterium]|nr:preprotein translocase subunit SecE [Candidatus Eremiobacteraeota bacterium]
MNNNKNVVGRGAGTAGRQARAAQTQDFVRGIFLEMRRVTWPTNEEWISATILTILLVVSIGLFTYGVDWLFGQIFSHIHG